jgi:hypothetical protein
LKFSKDVDVETFDETRYNIINTTGKRGYSELKREVMTWDSTKYLNQVRCVNLVSKGFYIYKMLDNETHDILVYISETDYAKRQRSLIRKLYRRGTYDTTVSISRLVEDYRNSSNDNSNLSWNEQKQSRNNADVNAEKVRAERNNNGRGIAQNDDYDNLQERRQSIDIDDVNVKSLINQNEKLQESVEYLENEKQAPFGTCFFLAQSKGFCRRCVAPLD